MLKQAQGREHYIHICKYNHGIEINLHDVQPYMIVNGKLVHIKYCPFCGVEIEKEER